MTLLTDGRECGHNQYMETTAYNSLTAEVGDAIKVRHNGTTKQATIKTIHSSRLVVLVKAGRFFREINVPVSAVMA